RQGGKFFSAGVFQRVSHFPWAFQRRCGKSGSHRPNRKSSTVRPLARAASLIVAGAWAIRRDEAIVDLNARGDRPRHARGDAVTFTLGTGRPIRIAGCKEL